MTPLIALLLTLHRLCSGTCSQILWIAHLTALYVKYRKGKGSQSGGSSGSECLHFTRKASKDCEGRKWWKEYLGAVPILQAEPIDCMKGSIWRELIQGNSLRTNPKMPILLLGQYKFIWRDDQTWSRSGAAGRGLIGIVLLGWASQDEGWRPGLINASAHPQRAEMMGGTSVSCVLPTLTSRTIWNVSCFIAKCCMSWQVVWAVLMAYQMVTRTRRMLE